MTGGIGKGRKEGGREGRMEGRRKKGGKEGCQVVGEVPMQVGSPQGVSNECDSPRVFLTNGEHTSIGTCPRVFLTNGEHTSIGTSSTYVKKISSFSFLHSFLPVFLFEFS
jgi:hypothetical protein